MLERRDNVGDERVDGEGNEHELEDAGNRMGGRRRRRRRR
jgi:hypothetical protein